MSASILHLLSPESLKKILGTKFECETLDFKKTLNLNTRRDQVELAHDVLAMANTLGGFIVVGVEDKTFRITGLREELSVHFKEGKSLNDKLSRLLKGQIVVHSTTHRFPTDDGGEADVAFVFVPPREKLLPAPTHGNYPCEDQSKQKDNFAFREGDILLRKADCSTKAVTENDIIRRAYDPDMDYLQFFNPCENVADFVNPYNIAFTARDEMFKGRGEEASRLLQLVSSGNHVTVYGLQRVGKTSLVHKVFHDYFQRDIPQNKLRFASVELQEIGSDRITQKQFLTKILEAIVEAMEATASEMNIKNAFNNYLATSPLERGDQMGLFTGFRRVVEAFTQKSDKNIVLFLDEFAEVCLSIERSNELTTSSGSKYHPTKMHPHEMYIDVPFMKQFSSLLKSDKLHKKLTFIFAARPFVADYDAKKGMQVMKLTKPITLFYLNEQAAKALMTEPIRDCLIIDTETVDYLYRLTSGHPYLIQFFMQELVDVVTSKGKRAIGLNDVKSFEQRMTRDGAPYAAQFEVLDSDYSVEEVTNPQTRNLGRGALALISRIGTEKPEGWVSEDEIKHAMAQRHVTESDASAILGKLEAAEIIQKKNRSGVLCLRVSVPLLRKRYVDQNMYQQYFPEQRR